MEGERASTDPRGDAKGHPAMDLLRYKQCILKVELPDDVVCGPRVLHIANDAFRKMRTFLDYISEVLTTDANGVPLTE